MDFDFMWLMIPGIIFTISMSVVSYNKDNKKADLLKICYEQYHDTDRCKKDIEELMR